MRFLETQTAKETGVLRLVEKRANELPKYAIVSHTWEEDEITFEDIENGKANDISTKSIATLASLSKLRGACIQAAADGYEYIWIDTCCIDKRSSAELSEAINSMFVWYRDAGVCYAFLRDSPNELGTEEAKSQFTKNKWFMRGWTLQELLAPAEVIFFSGDWTPVGEKKLLCVLLSDITGIDQEILLGDRSLTSASIARRMSWAAKRITTRPEDRAYCLMGLFSVNMPMLYGEGAEKAFLRLQEEIMKQSDDQSIFAWVNLSAPPEALEGLLASEPSQFLYSHTIIPYEDWEPRAPYTFTNRGLKIDLHLTALEDNVYVAALDCPVPPDYKDSSFLAMYLQKLSDSDEKYARIRVGQFASVQTRGRLQTIYVQQKPEAPSLDGAFLQHQVQLRDGPSPDIYKLMRVLIPGRGGREQSVLPSREHVRAWVPNKWPIFLPILRKPAQLSAAIIFQRVDGESLVVMIGTLSGFDIAFHVLDSDSAFDLDEITFKDMGPLFEPSLTGRFEKTYHSVRVSTTPIIRSSMKTYLVDIGIEAVNFSLRQMLRQTVNAAPGSGRDDAITEVPSVIPKKSEDIGKGRVNIKKKASFWGRIQRGKAILFSSS
ncbi:HET-domain-containing protein [Jackrogersella minutella]|nr:HET-domain-containing protein [Jackrogersella minutella]